MNAPELIKRLEKYRGEFDDILGRFKRSSDGIYINREDDPRFRTFVIEIIDLLNDSFGRNQYSPLINNIFNEGISGFSRSPSYASIEEIASVLKAIETRLTDNPGILNKKDQTPESIKTSLALPEKMTLKWLWEHVPYRFWAWSLALLFAAFTLGITFSETSLYKSLTKEATAITPQNTKTNTTSEYAKTPMKPNPTLHQTANTPSVLNKDNANNEVANPRQ